jgi:hypothetical protein
MATQEIKDALAAHNAARHAAQGVKRPDLVWDERLASDAQKWATHLADNNLFQHEGMWAAPPHPPPPPRPAHQPFKKGVEAWVNEKPNYHGEKIAEGDFSGYGHYTQVCFLFCG